MIICDPPATAIAPGGKRWTTKEHLDFFTTHLVNALKPGGIFVFSLLFSPNQGVLARLWQRLQLSLQVAQDHMLLALVRRDEEVEEHAKLRPDELVGSAAVWGVWARMAFAKLRRRSLVQQADGLIGLSAAGEQEALGLLRKHRLWETYMNRLGFPEDHVHDPADAIEHFS